MKFNIDYNEKKEKHLLIYIPEECSFDMKPYNYSTDLHLALNYLDLMVLDKKVIQISGVCGLSISMQSNYNVPKYEEGALIVMDDLEIGVGSYIINKEKLPVYVNIQTGWVCIGNPNKEGKAVEFIDNCVAVIDDNKEFLSLWLKPLKLPNL